ncbi:MAG: hypothetical protein WBQ59_28845 [Candidatus Acidiferrum sp.]
MRISTDALVSDIEPAVNWVGGLIGAAADKRVAGVEKQDRANPLLAAHFRENFKLEFALAAARKYRRNTGRLPKGEEYDPLYSFLIPAQRIHAALPAVAKTPYEGRLRDAVNGAHGMRPFAYEISIATHLMQKGWDVEFVDYAGVARFDFLARQDSVEVEIECKTTSNDTGRKIHRQEVNRLGDLLLPVREQLAERQGCHRILVTVPDRLSKSNDVLRIIASSVSAAVDTGAPVSTEAVQVGYTFESLDSWPQPDREPETAVLFFEQRFGRQNTHLLFHGLPGFSVVAIMVVSAKPDSVVNTIAEQAKEAAEQCSGTRPALIALHLVDPLDRDDLQSMLRMPNGIHTITHAVFRNENRWHVDSIAFTVPQMRRTDQSGARWLSGDLVTLNNPQPRFVCPELRSIFRAAA